MPLVTIFNLRKEDRLSEIEEAVRKALTSMPPLEIRDNAVDVIPVVAPDSFPGTSHESTLTSGKRRGAPKRPCRSLPRESPRLSKVWLDRDEW